MKRIASLAVALLATLILVASVSAAKPTDSISLDQANPSAGDTITFTTSGGNFVEVKCWSGRPHNFQNLLWGQGRQLGESFTLSFARAAECEAELVFYDLPSRDVLAKIRFDVTA